MQMKEGYYFKVETQFNSSREVKDIQLNAYFYFLRKTRCLLIIVD